MMEALALESNIIHFPSNISEAREEKYYTLTCEYHANGEGITRMILITFRESSKAAYDEFKRIFGDYYSIGVEVSGGILINPQFECLLTDDVKKIITQIKSEDRSAPHFHYFTSLHINYPQENS